MLTIILQFISDFWPALLGVVTLTWLLSNKYGYGIQQIPGPFLAPFSNWWRLYQITKLKNQYVQMDLHKKYGDVVRLGPKVLSFGTPAAREVIYGYTNNTFIKSHMYRAQQTNYKGERVESMFSTTNEKLHGMLRRTASQAFAMSNLKNYEHLMQSTLKKWLSQTEKLYSGSGEVCDITTWTQFFAFDVIGQLAWSKNIGFVDKNEDVDGIVRDIYLSNREKIIIGQQPLLDFFKDKNPIKFWLARHGLWPFENDPLIRFARKRMVEREEELKKIEESDGKLKPTFDLDFLARTYEMQKKFPDFLDEQRILALQVSLVNAGSESTAATIAGVLRFLLKHPRVYAKLLAEIDNAFASGSIKAQDEIVTWHDAQNLPYLDAVVQETWRVYTPAGANLERIVTEENIHLCGHHIPKGTVVSCNAWVIHRSKEVFGEDADDFVPERWLESPPEKLSKMRNTMMQFGGGPRFCIGSNVARMEIYKTIPSFLRRFEIEFAEPGVDWNLKTHFLAKPSGFKIRIKARTPPSAHPEVLEAATAPVQLVA